MNLFQLLYTAEFELRLKLDELQFKQISKLSRYGLEKVFSEEEMLDSLRICNGDKVPGPDDFNMKFLQEF